MTEQLKTLQLADLMFDKPDSDGHCTKAAKELIRLNTLCDEMGEALKRIVEFSSPMTAKQRECWPDMRAALTKWEASK